MLIGHSSGAHLCMMAALELTLKRLLHNPDAVVMPEGFVPEGPQLPALGESIRFHDRYFDGSSNDEDGSETVTPPVMISGPATPPVLALRSGTSTPPILKSANPDSSINTGSFYVLGDSGNDREHSSLESDPEAFYLISRDNVSKEKSESSEESMQEQPSESEDSKEKSDTEKEVTDETQGSKQKATDDDETFAKQPVEVEAIPTTSTAEDATQGTEELIIEDEDMMTPSQKNVRDLLHSIKHIIGKFAFVSDLKTWELLSLEIQQHTFSRDTAACKRCCLVSRFGWCVPYRRPLRIRSLQRNRRYLCNG